MKFGLAVGTSTTSVAPSDLLITDASGAESLIMRLESANYGVHGGIFLSILMKKFFIRPAAYFNSNSADFRIQDISSGEVKLLREKYQNLDIPFLMGFKFGPLRLQGGPVGHLFIDCQSELDQIDGYEKKFEDLTYGWQAGFGLDIWKISIDLNYEGNFSRFGDHINVFGQPFAFDQNPSRFVGTLGFTF